MDNIKNYGDNMKNQRKIVLNISRYLMDNKNFYFPFFIRCKCLDGRNDYIEIVPQEDDYKMILNSDDFTDFILVEKSQDLHEDTIQLMPKGFIDKIMQESLKGKIKTKLNDYKEIWNEDGWETLTKSKSFGDNEFYEGKTEAFEQVLEMIDDSALF